MDDQQSSEEFVDWNNKHNVQDDVNKRDIAVNKTGRNGSLPRVSTQTISTYRTALTPLLENPHHWMPL